MKEFEIYFFMLTPQAQKDLLKTFNIQPKDHNWDTFPIATIQMEESNAI